MTIVQRIQLHKLGYTKEEINELEKADYNPDGLNTAPETAEPPAETAPETTEVQTPTEVPKDTNAEILKAIQGLTATIQQSNITHSRQPETTPAETAEDILSKLL